ncbi:hypothetical protein [Lactococcus petauri]|uniref:hypothetical protein n=1 Tax=Lactococcus petauri TaxID=1940789 RepID=UPI0022E3BA23|nr:hypothetical protein [Lactococcus petauri]
MIIFILLSLLINVILIILLFTFINKKLKDLTIFIFIYILSLIAATVVSYLWFNYFNIPKLKITLSNLQPLISPTVTTLGLIITVGISYMTIRFNQKKQEIDLIYSLIKDQKSLIDTTGVKNVSKSIKVRCQEELTTSNIAFIRIVKFIKENQDSIFTNRSLNQSTSKLINTYLFDNKGLISDRKIDQFVLCNWELYILPKANNFFKKNKIAHANIAKGLKSTSKTQEKYEKIGEQIFNSNDATYLFKFLDDKSNLEINKIRSNVKYDEAVEIFNNIYRINYYELGHMFKHFHRIIRLILEGLVSKDPKIQKELLGILRAQFPEDILVLIYYNASYTYRGYGLGCLLQGTKFFGDSGDFESIKNTDIQKEKTHISSSNFYFPDIDNKILQDIYGSGKLLNVPKKNKSEQQIKFVNRIKNLQNDK